jgi:hypothetical protein
MNIGHMDITNMKICSKNIAEDCYKIADKQFFAPNKRICFSCLKEKNRRFYAANHERLNLKERANVKFQEQYKPVDYANGVIYKLVNQVDDKIYVGSTGDEKSRWKSHCQVCKTDDRLVYEHLRSVGWHNVKMKIVEQFPCNNRYELETRERYWIEQLKPELNLTQRPRISAAEKQESKAACSRRYHQKLKRDTIFKQMKSITDRYSKDQPCEVLYLTLN